MTPHTSHSIGHAQSMITVAGSAFANRFLAVGLFWKFVSSDFDLFAL